MITETYEDPKELTAENVQYWCKHTKELKQSQSNKAISFVKYDCIQYIGPDNEFGSKYCFVCLPLNKEPDWTFDGITLQKKPYPANYNSSVYKIYKDLNGNFCCNCQGWQTKFKRNEIIPNGVNCSHVLALFYAFKLKRFGIQHGATEEQIKLDRLE